VHNGDDLTTFIVPNVEKIRSLDLPDPQRPVQARSAKTLPLPFLDLYPVTCKKCVDVSKVLFPLIVGLSDEVSVAVMSVDGKSVSSFVIARWINFSSEEMEVICPWNPI
jgi:hypothetical protein